MAHQFPDQRVYLGRNLFIDFHLNTITRDGFALYLSATQSRILQCLAHNIGHPISYQELIQYAWGKPQTVTARELYVYINRIRSKLGSASRLTEHIVTIHGYGYMLVTEKGDDATTL